MWIIDFCQSPESSNRFSYFFLTWFPLDSRKKRERLKVKHSGLSKPSGDKPSHLSRSVSIPHFFCVYVCECAFVCLEDHSEVDPPHLSVTCLNEAACGQHRAKVLSKSGLGSLYVCVYVCVCWQVCEEISGFCQG